MERLETKGTGLQGRMGVGLAEDEAVAGESAAHVG